jgi:hypothetical protein
MSWSLKRTAHATHFVYKQGAVNSCGIASVIMVNFKVKKWRIAAAALSIPSPMLAVPSMGAAVSSTIKSEQEVDAAYAKVTGQPYDGTTYTDALQLQTVLSELGIGKWVCEFFSQTQLAKKISQLVGSPTGFPVITHVMWNSGGAHFVVCDTVVRTQGKVYADMCDPGDASANTVALIDGQPIPYQDATGSQGSLSGWIVYRKGP